MESVDRLRERAGRRKVAAPVRKASPDPEINKNPALELFGIDDRVEKVGGDYIFSGHIRAVFKKKSGAIRYVVENDQGILHIFSHPNLAKGS